MTTETKTHSMIFNGARDAVSETLSDAAHVLWEIGTKVDLIKLGLDSRSVDIEYDKDHCVEVKMRIFKKAQ